MPLGDLPYELRRSIWEYALPEDTQEVCIPWPLQEEALPITVLGYARTRSRKKFLRPFLVDTDFPVLMHICHETREFAKSRLSFRYSLVAGCQVPFRRFNPDLDIMYYSRWRPTNDDHIDDYEWGGFPETLKHLAVDLHTIRDGSNFCEVFCHHFHLETITCVLPAPGAMVLTCARFRPPVRRCRLRPVEQPSDGSLSHFIRVDGGSYSRITSMSRYLEEVRGHIDTGFLDFLRDDGQMHPDFRPRWDARRQSFKFGLFAKMFEEYRGGEWVPSSKHTVRFDHQYVRSRKDHTALQKIQSYKVTEEELWTPMRNPETFRVNDIQQNEVKFED